MQSDHSRDTGLTFGLEPAALNATKRPYPCDLPAARRRDPAGKLDSHRLQPRLQTNTEQSSSHQTGQDASSHRTAVNAVPTGDCCMALGSPSRPGASCKQSPGACSATVLGQN